MPHVALSSWYTSWGAQGSGSFYYTFGGKTSCNFTQHLPATIIHYIAKSMYYDFPHRLARRLNAGDACPPDIHCDCDNHPDGSHRGGYSLDFDYYTLTDSNITQYALPGTPRVKLFTDQGTLKTDVFDWQRNYVFWTRMQQAFPMALFMIDERIEAYMLERVRATLGQKPYQAFCTLVQGDSVPEYNHWKHAHCKGLEVVNLLALTENWTEQEWRMAA